MDIDSRVDELLASRDMGAATERRRTELLLSIARHPPGAWVDRLRAHDHTPFWVERAEDVTIGAALLPCARFAVDLDEAEDEALRRLSRSDLRQVASLYLESRQLSVELATRLADAAPPLEFFRLDGPVSRDVMLALMPLLVETPEVRLHGGAIDDAMFVELAGRLRATVELGVYGCAIGAAGVEALVSSEGAIRTLDLSMTAVDHEAVEILCRSALPIESLDLGESASGDRGAASIARATFASSLRSLSLAHTGLTDSGAIAITSTALPCLRRLNLSGNPLIGVHGLEAIASSPHVAAIEDFDLSDNGIVTREQVQILADSTALHPTVRDEWREILASLRPT